MKTEIIGTILVILALIWATWYVVVKASEPRIESVPPCIGVGGHENPQWWCDKRDENAADIQ